MNNMVEEILVQSLFNEFLDTAESRLNVVKLAGDASTRKYYRVSTSSKSFVCCLDNPTSKPSDFEEVTNFLNKYKIPAPKIFHSDYKKGFLVQEDLGNDMLVNYLSKDYDEEKIIVWYKKAIDIILSFQKINISDAPEFVQKRMFDQNKYLFEFNLTNTYFIEKYLNYKMTESKSKQLSLCQLNIIENIIGNPFVITHRDFHSRNLMIKNNSLRVIDYQDLMLGTIFYDLVSLLEDTYFPLKENVKNSLIKYFIKNLDSNYSDQEFEKLYDYNSIQRIYKALGSFTFIYNSRGDDRYLKYIGIGVDKLVTKLEKYSDLSSFLSLILSAYNENR